MKTLCLLVSILLFATATYSKEQRVRGYLYVDCLSIAAGVPIFEGGTLKFAIGSGPLLIGTEFIRTKVLLPKDEEMGVFLTFVPLYLYYVPYTKIMRTKKAGGETYVCSPVIFLYGGGSNWGEDCSFFDTGIGFTYIPPKAFGSFNLQIGFFHGDTENPASITFKKYYVTVGGSFMVLWESYGVK